MAKRCSGNPRLIGQWSVRSIAMDATRVDWVQAAQTDSAVMAVAKTGGTPVSLASRIALPTSVAVDATNLYFTLGAGTVNRCALTGCGGSSQVVRPDNRIRKA